MCCICAEKEKLLRIKVLLVMQTSDLLRYIEIFEYVYIIWMDIQFQIGFERFRTEADSKNPNTRIKLKSLTPKTRNWNRSTPNPNGYSNAHL